MTHVRCITINEIDRDIKQLQSEIVGYKISKSRLQLKNDWHKELICGVLNHGKNSMFDEYTMKTQPLSEMRTRTQGVEYAIYLLDQLIKDAKNAIRHLNSLRKIKYEPRK